MKLVISDEAEMDLGAIGDYVARFNPTRAESLLRELGACCFDLISMP